MRLRSLRSFSLLAILSCRSSRHYARAQSTSASTYTWGEPFTVDYSSTASLIPNSASSPTPTSIPLQTLSATGTTASPSASTTNAAYTRKPHPLTMGIVGVIAGTAGLLVV